VAWARENTLDQVLDGYTEHWDPTDRWAYNTGEAVRRRAGSVTPGTVLRAPPSPTSPIGTGATSFNVFTDKISPSLAYPLWSTTAADIDIEIGGETDDRRQPFSSVGVGVWTLNVTRSVNGVVKGRTAGTDVRLWNRPFVAL